MQLPCNEDCKSGFQKRWTFSILFGTTEFHHLKPTFQILASKTIWQSSTQKCPRFVIEIRDENEVRTPKRSRKKKKDRKSK